MYDIVVIGAGAAGLTAAIYATRAEKKVLVLEGKTYGGQIINSLSVENYPGMYKVSGPDFAKALYEQAKELGAEIGFEAVTKVNKLENGFEIVTEDDKYEAKVVIIATGSEYRKLGLPLEKELEGKGLSYCATCDGAFFKDKEVIVNGGGNTALYDAEYLARICKKVYLVHRRSEFRGDKALFDRVKALSNVEIVAPAVISELLPEDGKFAGVVLSSTDGETGDAILGEPKELRAEGLFVAIGSKPSSEVFEGLVEMDENGYIVASEDCKTSVPGIFVAGDVRTSSLKQLVTATADGARAATEAVKAFSY
ncbi:MAG: FAD-dependent oxidoreductase [Candidatus Saccharibacteria bacterium]|nr:FAD-dependent oxidoreductase [Candidatus Saccharibacteria bacterium]